MPRYVAFLRGVSPLNAKMSDLKTCFERAGFTDVVTVLSSGNVVFNAVRSTASSFEKRIEFAMEKYLGRVFYTIVRSVEELQKLLNADPYKKFKLNPKAKRVVSFLRCKPTSAIKLPDKLSGAEIHRVIDREIYSTYVPGPQGPVFMTLIEKTFGKNLTTRTWDTVKKVAGR